jgi:plastocyanin
MRRTIFLILSCVLIIAGLLATVSCGSSYQTPTPTSTSTQTQGNAVSIQNMAFSPATITVSVGTTVTWTNNDATIHTVTSNTGLFESGQLSKGSHFSHTFSTAGTFAYHCSIHPEMTGTVKVQ